jgi:hypothetical protein
MQELQGVSVGMLEITSTILHTSEVDLVCVGPFYVYCFVDIRRLFAMNGFVESINSQITVLVGFQVPHSMSVLISQCLENGTLHSSHYRAVYRT